MLIKSSYSNELTENDVTDETIYHSRRKILTSMGYLGAGALLASASSPASAGFFGSDDDKKSTVFETSPLEAKKTEWVVDQPLTTEEKVTTFNNFYEFGTRKSDPVEYSQDFNVNPWTLKVTGLVNNELTLDYDDLFKVAELEERIYRLRCVEAWSMVIPWIGFSLSALIKKADPKSEANFVRFKTLYDPKQMRGQASRRIGGGIRYPYVEGLRLDEAMNPLALMSVGLYGKTLPPQNGAPVRLVVPWKYGFKSIKSIVEIELLRKQPRTTWQLLAPDEYGFYANVNPAVDHPRWSQASERRITRGGLFSQTRIETLPFNGYGKQVAHLYKNMDLAKFY